MDLGESPAFVPFFRGRVGEGAATLFERSRKRGFSAAVKTIRDFITRGGIR